MYHVLCIVCILSTMYNVSPSADGRSVQHLVQALHGSLYLRLWPGLPNTWALITYTKLIVHVLLTVILKCSNKFCWSIKWNWAFMHVHSTSSSQNEYSNKACFSHGTKWLFWKWHMMLDYLHQQYFHVNNSNHLCSNLQTASGCHQKTECTYQLWKCLAFIMNIQAALVLSISNQTFHIQ